MIEHSNIIYMPNISALGGIETYVYEMVKKYKDLDIAVVSKHCDSKQAQRIRKYCKLYIHKNEIIKCDVAIINYDTSIIPFIVEGAKIYETIHGDYSNRAIYNFLPPTDDRITGYIAITKYLQGKVKELINKDNVIMSYNPLTIENNGKPLILVSATRLHKNKGLKRMQALMQALDRRRINYIWYIFTGDIQDSNNLLTSPNVIILPSRLDVYRWIDQADYVVLLSDSEALSYTINEGLYRNIPVIVTPLPYLKEIGVEHGKNAYIMEFDCSNVDEIADNILNIPEFTFDKLEDKYAQLFTKKKSYYEEEKMIEVKCVYPGGYYDVEEGRQINDGEIFYVTKERVEYLKKHNAIEIIEQPVKQDLKAKSTKKKSK